MNTLIAKDGMWLFNGESFAMKVSGFGDLSKWEEEQMSIRLNGKQNIL